MNILKKIKSKKSTIIVLALIFSLGINVNCGYSNAQLIKKNLELKEELKEQIQKMDYYQRRFWRSENYVKEDNIEINNSENPSTSSNSLNELSKELGIYTITAYCGCDKCCGKYASNRALDEFGIPIVTGAEGTRLVSGFSAASPLPFGTKIYLDGYGEVKIQDRTASSTVEKYNGKIIDIYFDSHEEALQFGKRHLQAFIIKEEA